MGNERVWPNFLVAYLFPVIGGLVNYFLSIKRDKDLASICLVASILNPILIPLIFGVIFGVVLGIYAGIFTILIFLVMNWFFIAILFKENRYKYFLPTFYFGIIGLIYSYFKYKENAFLQRNVLIFAIASTIAGIVISALFSWFLIYWLLGGLLG